VMLLDVTVAEAGAAPTADASATSNPAPSPPRRVEMRCKRETS
jgi:hypothetical protein